MKPTNTGSVNYTPQLSIADKIRENLSGKSLQELISIYGFLNGFMGLNEERTVLMGICKSLIDAELNKIIND